MWDNIAQTEYGAEAVDAPHALLSRIRAAKEARGEHRVQGGHGLLEDHGDILSPDLPHLLVVFS